MIQVVDASSNEWILAACFGRFHVEGHEPRARWFLYESRREAGHGQIAPREVFLTMTW